MKQRSAEAYIKGGKIVIELPITYLPNVLEGGLDHTGLNDVKVTDAKIFAQELVRALNEEEEDGTTLVHKMFDEGILDAVENGAEGVSFPGDGDDK